MPREPLEKVINRVAWEVLDARMEYMGVQYDPDLKMYVGCIEMTRRNERVCCAFVISVKDANTIRTELLENFVRLRVRECEEKVWRFKGE